MPANVGACDSIWLLMYTCYSVCVCVVVVNKHKVKNTTWSLHAVVVVILAEDRSIQEKLMYYDLKVQTIAQVAPIQLYAASVLSSLFAHLGRWLYVTNDIGDDDKDVTYKAQIFTSR